MNPLLLALFARFGIEPTEANLPALRAAVAKQTGVSRASMLKPRTVDAEARSIEAVIATEEPAEVWDYERWEPVDEILLMKGARLGKVRKGKLPLIDAHQRDTTRRVLGSVVDLHVEGTELVGSEVYSAVSEPEFVKATEGHLDQRSVGYRIFAATYIKPGESATVEGRPFTARHGRGLSVVTDWLPLECSIVAIGADPASGTRADTSATPPPNAKEPVPAMKITAEMRARLVSLGMPESATDEEAVAFLAKPETQRALAAPANPPAQKLALTDLESVTARLQSTDADRRLAALEAKVEQQNRTGQIETVFRSFAHVEGIAGVREKALADGVTIDQARGLLVAHLAIQTPSAGRAVITRDEADHRRDNAVIAFHLRANPGAKATDAERKQADYFRGMSLLDLARQCCEAAGISTRGMDKMSLAGRAFSATGDFTHILSSTANKQLMAAYAMAPQTWARWCKRGSLSDFKATPRVQMSDAGVLATVPEGAEFPQGSFTDTQENIQLATFGRIFAITRQAVINDDLDAFGSVPTKHARAWSRTINQQPVKVILANAALHDTGDLYNATAVTTAGGHANLTTTTVASTKATAEASIRAMRALMTAQKDADGESYLQIAPKFLLVTPTLALYYIQAVYETGVSSNNRLVDIARLGLEVLEEPELENSALTGYATDNIYMFADPADAATVEVAFLDGNDAPTLETQTGFEIDGIKMKVRGDVAAKALDFRGTVQHNPA